VSGIGVAVLVAALVLTAAVSWWLRTRSGALRPTTPTAEEVPDQVDAPPTGPQAVLERLGVRWSARDDLGKVSLIGAGMKSHPGIAAKTFATLDAEGIPVQVVTTSPIKIACHVPSELVGRAVRALHEAFELEAVVD
jgi:hypothetical protein